MDRYPHKWIHELAALIIRSTLGWRFAVADMMERPAIVTQTQTDMKDASHLQSLGNSCYSLACDRIEYVKEELPVPHESIQMLGHYRLLEEIGHGGMGRVYLAEDTRLGRQIALKVLPENVATDPNRLRRFETEARAAAALNHPNIVTLHSVEEDGGTRFITMELIRGQPLRQLVGVNGLAEHCRYNLAVQLANAVAAAHDAGITHRDLKPDNVMVLDSGVVKVLDFGLAKLAANPTPELGDNEATRTELDRTTPGVVLGTVSYMSPEQAQGYAVDFRSDIFSLGVLLFEMATGKRPFEGHGTVAVLSAIVKDTPPPLREVDPSLPEELESLVTACLAKDPASRPASATEVAKVLMKLRDQAHGRSTAAPERSKSRASQIAIWGGVLLIATVVVALIELREPQGPRWNNDQSLAHIKQLIDSGQSSDALELARSAPTADLVPNRLWREMTTIVTLRTDPAGASVSMRPWNDAEKGWTRIGETPLEEVRVASAVNLWRIEKQGYPTLELAYAGRPDEMTLRLVPDAALAHVPGGRTSLKYLPGFRETEPVVLADYLVDRKEITNREFSAFVDAGGYERAEYWAHPFTEEGRELSFDEAMSRFVDATGRPGPSTWQLGKYPEGQAEHPVAGISWFEAAAYAKFVGKHLPTIFHWFRASGQTMAPALIPAGNYAASGPRHVGPAVQPGAYGLYDMAGNMREWCLNASGDSRFILGGSWNDPSYMFQQGDHRPPFDRSPTNGFRCVDYSPNEGPLSAATASVVLALRDITTIASASDEEFEQFLRFYDYRPVELDAKVEMVGESPSWRRERVEYSAGYDDERMFAWLFLPEASRPPYQAVVLFPGANAFDVRSSVEVDDLVSWDAVDFVVEQGRAVLYPVFKQMYERKTSKTPREFDVFELP